MRVAAVLAPALAVVTIGLSGCALFGSAEGSEMAGAGVDLTERGGSGQSGTATLTEERSSTRVEIELRNAPAGPQPAHIHAGTCEQLGPIEHPLADVEAGSSVSTVPELLHILTGAGDAAYAIDVHEREGGGPVACGTLSYGLPVPQQP